jgi:5-methylcytosine-specific restriction endonuclease McrA
MTPVMSTCIKCGRPIPHGQSRCAEHAIPPRPRARASQAAIAAFVSTVTRCGVCGEGPRHGDPFVCDHIVPRAHGGSDHRDNWQGAHRSCNGRKGARLGNGGAWSR